MQDVKEMRKRLRLTQEGLARLLGVSFVTVNRWERETSRATRGNEALLRLLERALQHTAPDVVVERLHGCSNQLSRIETLIELGPQAHRSEP